MMIVIEIVLVHIFKHLCFGFTVKTNGYVNQIKQHTTVTLKTVNHNLHYNRNKIHFDETEMDFNYWQLYCNAG